MRPSFFRDQSQTLIVDGHLWSFFAAGDNRPDVYVGLLALISPRSTSPSSPLGRRRRPRGELGDVHQFASQIVLHTLPVLKHGPNTACGGKGS